LFAVGFCVLWSDCGIVLWFVVWLATCAAGAPDCGMVAELGCVLVLFAGMLL
jgi:hypothetical protein